MFRINFDFQVFFIVFLFITTTWLEFHIEFSIMKCMPICITFLHQIFMSIKNFLHQLNHKK